MFRPQDPEFIRWMAAAVVLAAVIAPGLAAASSIPVDCLPDSVVQWDAAQPAPELRFGAALLPGIVLGPPGSSLPINGSTSVASLGNGGSVVLAFNDLVIEDGPGPDFIVFENAFFIGAAPASPGDAYVLFSEPATVEVSADGLTWMLFPYDADALVDAGSLAVDATLYQRLQGLAGITPSFSGNWTLPEDPAVWDPSGTGGISGAGGDAFDLATVGLSEARFVRITDGNTVSGPQGAGEGFDLDAVVVLHGRPAPPGGLDSDGDGLPDAAEAVLYGTDPGDPDSDGDGIDDGREVSACRDPSSPSVDPAPFLEPRMWLQDAGCTEIRWTFTGSALLYDLARGNLDDLTVSASSIDLVLSVCLESSHPSILWTCDGDIPASGQGFFYLVRASGAPTFGHSSDFLPRQGAIGCP